MNWPHLETKNLRLVPHSPMHLRALIRGVQPYAIEFGYPPAEGLRDFFVSNADEISQSWLEQLEAATEADPWTFGYAMLHRERGEVIGCCSFKGPPSPEGSAEIAYGVVRSLWGMGYATEAAQALVDFAASSRLVRIILAHTMPEPNASTRVLTKCGFLKAGEVNDPEDGLVWRWERPVHPAS